MVWRCPVPSSSAVLCAQNENEGGAGESQDVTKNERGRSERHTKGGGVSMEIRM